MSRRVQGKEIFSLFFVAFVIMYMFVTRNNASFLQSISYLLGEEYDPKKWDWARLPLWCFLHAGFGIYLGVHLSRMQTENGYMSLMRYRSFRKYFQTVFVNTTILTLVYDVIMNASIIINTGLLYSLWNKQPRWDLLGQIMALNLCSHLFWGSVSAFLIVVLNRMKEALVIYPGIVFWNLVVCAPFSESVCKWFPGNWTMLRRSEVLLEGGFSVATACGILLVLWVVISAIWTHGSIRGGE